MLLLRGATPEIFQISVRSVVSIHAPLARSNRLYCVGNRPRWRVSIHAPLARSNSQAWRDCSGNPFQYMLLLRGATGSGGAGTSAEHRFNTCSSCEEQPLLSCLMNGLKAFQYMLLLRGATWSRNSVRCTCCFNTCSSCEEQR